MPWAKLSARVAASRKQPSKLSAFTMPRYRITIEYDGTPFVGWQFQANGVSVYEILVAALAKFTDPTTDVYGAGRTDAGVHAQGQVAHFDLIKAWDPFRLAAALNFHLKPHPIAVIGCELAPPGFHARFSAIKRHYTYRILARRAPPALDKNRVWWVPVPLDAERMHKAAQHLVGQHDFTTFRAAGCQATSPIKTVERLDVERVGDEIHIHASARSFLHRQVRSLVGSLKRVGEGQWQDSDIVTALAACDRSACGPVAPPMGLYLTQVDYPPDPQLATALEQPAFQRSRSASDEM